MKTFKEFLVESKIQKTPKEYTMYLSPEDIKSFKTAKSKGHFGDTLKHTIYHGKNDSEHQDVTFHTNTPKKFADKLDRVIDFGATTAHDVMNLHMYNHLKDFK